MFAFVKHELEFIRDRIVISDQRAGQSQGLTLEDNRDVLLSLPPNSLASQGLRTIAGSLNAPRPGRLEFDAQETVFPRVSGPEFRDVQDLPFDPDGPGPHHDLARDDVIGMR